MPPEQFVSFQAVDCVKLTRLAPPALTPRSPGEVQAVRLPQLRVAAKRSPPGFL